MVRRALRAEGARGHVTWVSGVQRERVRLGGGPRSAGPPGWPASASTDTCAAVLSVLDLSDIAHTSPLHPLVAAALLCVIIAALRASGTTKKTRENFKDSSDVLVLCLEVCARPCHFAPLRASPAMFRPCAHWKPHIEFKISTCPYMRSLMSCKKTVFQPIS